MPLNSSSIVNHLPFIQTTRRLFTFQSHHVNFHTFSLLFSGQHIPGSNQYKSKPPHIVSSSKFDINYSLASSIMEEEQEKSLCLDKSLEGKYSKELDVAVRAVQMACFLCQKLQENFISKSNIQVQSKDDNSPVTLAGISHYFLLSVFFFFYCCCVH